MKNCMRSGVIQVKLFYTTFIWKEYEVHLAARKEGLCFISVDDQGLEELYEFHRRYVPERLLEKNDEQMESYKVALRRFLNGQATTFELPLHIEGSDFQKQVWEKLKEIPYGTTQSYTEVAQSIQRPEAVRAVANAIGQNPLLFVIPCHRVLRKDGSLSGFRAGVHLKEKLLRLEKKTVLGE